MTTGTIISICIAAASFIFGMYQYLTKNHKEDTATTATVIAKLENISETTRAIQAAMEDLKREVRMDHDVLIKVEASLKAAWRAIDELKEELGDKPNKGG